MPSIENLESALYRERKAREKAENLLEDKTRELYLLNQSLQNQNKILEKKNEELKLYASIAKIAEPNFDKFDIMSAYIESICHFSAWPVGHIYDVSIQDNHTRITPTSIWYLADKQKFEPFVKVTEKTCFEIGKCLPGMVVKEKKAIWIKDVFLDPNFPLSKFTEVMGLHHAIYIPISRYGEVIAVAEFFSEQNEESKANLLATAETSAIQLSTILERGYSEKQLRDNYTNLQDTLHKLKATQSQLVQSSKLASIGQLAAGVAHEINNPIAFVANNTYVMKKYMAAIKEVLELGNQLLTTINEPEKLISMQKKITALREKNNLAFILEDIDSLIADSLEGMDRVTDIVSGLKNFSRVDEAEIKEVCINACIESTIRIIWNELKYKCSLKKDLSELPQLKCYPSQLNQVFMNLLVNAGQAISETGEITIQTHATESDIFVEISDTGEGIPEENLEKLFDPFFTTKPVGSGTGLGLSITYGIIQKHNGNITVDSSVGLGTTFKIQLPLKGVSDSASTLPQG